MDRTTDHLLNGEPQLYQKLMGKDPYAIWVTSLSGRTVEKRPARLLAYDDIAKTKAHVIYLDGSRDVVFEEQMTARRRTTK
ncbi:hypothetical protein [Thalassospira lohafexi]|uniref:Uncharacterized protein n=1 Tax=Thalassospira lohafexi TaxID=744227 RepID=A0A2N3L0J8_9PROT|nr:hypothetical protein [Thalassospira lohafexi]PKR56328.1 hypothetical protein COO92_21215 [Thalassospira lohafexi]